MTSHVSITLPSQDPYRNPELFRWTGSMEGVPEVEWIDPAESAAERSAWAAWQAAGHPVRRLRERWSLERQVRLVVGIVVLASVIASLFVPVLVVVAGLMGAGLAFAALTDTCAMAGALSKLPYNRTESCDFDAVFEQLEQAA